MFPPGKPSSRSMRACRPPRRGPPCPATIAAGVIGVALAGRLVAFDGWTLLLIPWFAWRGDPAEVVYALVVVAVYWFAMRAEVRDHVRRLRRGGRTWRERLRDLRSYAGEPG